MRKPKRVGVLHGSTTGTTVVPGLLLETDGNMVQVLIEDDNGAPLSKRTCKEYADTPLPATLAHPAWQAAYQRLEATPEAQR